MRPARLLVLIACLPGGLLAQSRFDLIVVKPNPHIFGSYGRPEPGGRFLWTGFTVEQLVSWAYGVQSFQVQGGPAWVKASHWDIEAKVEGMRGSLDKDSVRPLLQNLLASRFGLRIRKEDRPGDVYELQVTPKGALLHEGDGENWELKAPRGTGYLPPPPPPPAPPGYAGPPPNLRKGGSGSGMGLFYLDGAPISRFVSYLTNRMQLPITDKTGLTGTYEGVLLFNDGEGAGPSIFQAMKEEWGLQLAKHKGANPYIVIEAITKPTEN